MSLILQLTEEHSTLLPLISQLQQAAESGDKERLRMLVAAQRAKLKEQLDAHIVLEEEVAFPTMMIPLGQELLSPFQEEHREIRALRDELLTEAAAGNVSTSLCLVFCDLLTGHMLREDLMLFPGITAVLAPMSDLAYR